MDASPPGRRLIVATTLVTGLFVLAVVVALVVGGVALRVLVFISVAMFLVGCCAFLWAFAISVGRSRYETIALSTVYGLSGIATKGVRSPLFGSIAVEVIAALAGAALRPFTPMAFGVLAPMFAIGMTGLWGARYGGVSVAPPVPVDEAATPDLSAPKPESRS